MRLCVPTGQGFVTGGLTDYGWLEWADSSVDIQTHKVDKDIIITPNSIAPEGFQTLDCQNIGSYIIGKSMDNMWNLNDYIAGEQT